MSRLGKEALEFLNSEEWALTNVSEVIAQRRAGVEMDVLFTSEDRGGASEWANWVHIDDCLDDGLDGYGEPRTSLRDTPGHLSIVVRKTLSRSLRN